MSVTKLEGVTIPSTKKKRTPVKNPRADAVLFYSKWDDKKKKYKTEAPGGYLDGVNVYEKNGKAKIQVFLVKSKDNPITKEQQRYIESRTASFQLEKKEPTAYAVFTKKEVAKWKKEHPGQKVDLSKLSKEIAKKWKTSPEKTNTDTARAIKTMERKRG